MRCWAVYTGTALKLLLAPRRPELFRRPRSGTIRFIFRPVQPTRNQYFGWSGNGAQPFSLRLTVTNPPIFHLSAPGSARFTRSAAPSSALMATGPGNHQPLHASAFTPRRTNGVSNGLAISRSKLSPYSPHSMRSPRTKAGIYSLIASICWPA